MKIDNPNSVHLIPDDQDEEITFVDYIATAHESRKLILSITLAITLASLLYAVLVRPTYQVDVTVQVEDSDLSQQNLLGDLAPLLGTKSATTAEIELFRSRLVVANAVSKLGLNIDARPRYFPLVGAMLATSAEAHMLNLPLGTLAAPLLGLNRFAWGGERIEVPRFDVPKTYWDKKFTLVTSGRQSYELLSPDGDVVLKGTVGSLAQGRLDDGPVTLLIQDLNARDGTEFTVVRSSEIDTVSDLQENLDIEEKGKESGILNISLKGKDASKITATLNSLAHEYVRQNVELKSEEAQKTLDFLDRQLPELKAQLDEAEQKYNDFRNRSGTVDLTAEGKLILQQAVDSNTALLELQRKRIELAQRYTVSHPAILNLDKQIAAAKTENDALASHISRLPTLEQSELRLMRDVAVDTDLYTGLLNSAQQLRVLKAGKVGNVRVVDFAVVPEKPVKPKKIVVVVLGVVLGLFLGFCTALVRRALTKGVEDGEAVERATGLSVYAAIPHSEHQRTLNAAIHGRKSGLRVLANLYPDDITVESLRSLRTSLHFAMLDAPNNVVMITGPSPSVGKSFIASNLAAILAASGQRVLLVDADLRRGHVHDFFGVTRSPGMSELITGAGSLTDCIRSNVLPNLDFVGTGTIPPNPSELLLNHRFSEALQAVAATYDVVLMDTPPVLAVTDSAILGRFAGTTLLTLRYGRHPIAEIEEAVRRLRHGGVSPKGVLFNDIPRRSLGYGRYYGQYYTYEYQREANS